MRRNRLVLGVALALLVSPATAEPPPVVAATLFPQGAWLIRETTVPADLTTVVLDDLPAGLADQPFTVQASGAQVIGSRVEPVDAAEATRAAERDLRTERRAVAERLAAVDDVGELAELRLEGQRGLIAALGNLGARDLLAAELRPNLWSGQLNALLAAAEVALAERREADREAAELERELERIDAALDRLGTTSREASRLIVDLAPGGTDDVTLRLSHYTQASRWQPLYRASLDAAAGEVTLEQRARVSQRTGEPWNGVTLSLSTARQSPMAMLPELPPWRVDVRPDPEPLRESMALSRAAAEDAPVAVSAEPLGLAHRFLVAEPADLAPDGAEISVLLARSVVAADLWTLSRPGSGLPAQLSVEVAAPGPAGFLGGPVELLRDGNVVAGGRLPRAAMDEPVTLLFGPDDRLLVEQDVVVERRGERGLIASAVRHERLVRTRYTNSGDTSLPLRVEDRMPIAADERIDVTLHPDATPLPNLDAVSGLATWEISLAPGETLEVEFGFVLSHPADVEVGGFPVPSR